MRLRRRLQRQQGCSSDPEYRYEIRDSAPDEVDLTIRKCAMVERAKEMGRIRLLSATSATPSRMLLYRT